eukprot:CAMPEP_0114567192 /NCGR_PEP_ID=MMETSP0114-20121206/15337_1 /TAXON_ID=31324 /ORGANISM="Goniomonas sp, Strain m" /LENGTH=93 /DNA_ID=CAMNT_0001753739 /DNA_START=27 /DNA_END=308 /DNA_ORIENTATION=+
MTTTDIAASKASVLGPLLQQLASQGVSAIFMDVPPSDEGIYQEVGFTDCKFDNFGGSQVPEMQDPGYREARSSRVRCVPRIPDSARHDGGKAP